MLEYKILDERIDECSLNDILNRLPSWRWEQALRFKHERGRRECALSYLLLADILGWQPEFHIGEHGKPYI